MSLRFRAGGGQPPQSHEVLLVAADGSGWYLTGMPWPAQPPFDEIGRYRVVGAALTDLARAALAAPLPEAGSAGAGTEVLELDGSSSSWGVRERGAAAEAFVAAARSVITGARGQPDAVLHARLSDGDVVLQNRGSAALALSGGELRSGWGRPGRAPSPLRLASAEPVAIPFPAVLAPGESVSFPRPTSGEDPERTAPAVLVHVRWRPEVAGEPEELDGWLVAGG